MVMTDKVPQTIVPSFSDVVGAMSIVQRHGVDIPQLGRKAGWRSTSPNRSAADGYLTDATSDVRLVEVVEQVLGVRWSDSTLYATKPFRCVPVTVAEMPDHRAYNRTSGIRRPTYIATPVQDLVLSATSLASGDKAPADLRCVTEHLADCCNDG